MAPWGRKLQKGHNLKLTLDILELMIKSKVKVLGIFKNSFNNYTKYYWKT